MASPALRVPRALNTRWRLLEPLLVIAAFVVTLLGSMAIGMTGYGSWIVSAVVAVAIGVAILVHPRLGVYILVVFIFANLSDVLEVRFGIPDTNKFLVALIFAGTFASLIMMEKKPIIFQLTEIAILLYGLVVIASLYFAPRPTDGISLVIDWLKDFAIILIIVQFSTEETVWKRAQWMIIFTASFLASLSVYQVLTGDYENDFFGLANAPVFQVTPEFDNYRVTGPIEDPNFYAMFLMMVLPLAAYRFLTAPTRSARLLGLLLAIPIFLAVLFTYSRGAFLALVIVAVLIAVERKISWYKIVPVVLAMVFLLFPVLPAGFVERLSTLTDIVNLTPRSQTELSLRGRSSEAVVAYRMFQDHPLLGVGRGNYEQYYLDYSSRLGIDSRFEEREAHSLYLELAAETGVLGIIAFSLMMIVIFGGMLRAKRTFYTLDRADLAGWVNGIQFGLVAYLLASIFLHSDYIRYFWLIVGLAASCRVAAEAQKARAKSQLASGFSPLMQV